ncbi:uncharacterized protein F54H12.2-like [Xenentodon cancila]
MAPTDVTSENTAQVFRNLYGTFQDRHKKIKMKFKKGDPVRISKLRGKFDKKYEQSFTDEVFTVAGALPRTPPVYKLEDYDREPIEGSFYEAEMQKVKLSKDRAYHVEKILGRRTVKAPMTQLSIEDKTYCEISPVSAITDRGPIEFFVPGDGDRYLDLNDTLLYLRVKVCNADGSDLADDARVSLINYPLNTIFDQCDVILGDRLISQSSATHPYRAMIETLLNYSEDTLKSQFTAGLFYKDTPGSMDSIVTVNGPNRGLCKRAGFVSDSKEVHLVGPIHADIFFSEKFLLNSVDLRVKLTRANDAFCLMGTADSTFKLKVIGASLFVKKVTVSPAVRLGHEAALLKGNALYPLSRVNVKTFSIPENSRICNQENLFLGTMPKYIVIAMTNHEAFTGKRNLNPFNFVHNNVEYLALSRDGRQIPAKAFQPQFNADQSVREFYNLFGATGRHLKDLPLCIDREDFAAGYTLFAFNLTPGDDCDALSPVSSGSLRLEMRFREPLPHTTTLIVYACFDSVLEINSKRQVLVDYY